MLVLVSYIFINLIIYKLGITKYLCTFFKRLRKCQKVSLYYVFSRKKLMVEMSKKKSGRFLTADQKVGRTIFLDQLQTLCFVEYQFCDKKSSSWNYFNRSNLRLRSIIHSVEITRIPSHTFLTKISWKQRFYHRSF